MATRARLRIDAVVGSDSDFPIGTLAQLDNDGLGGETTFLWSLLDQPAGAADALSNTTIANPTLTPRKEGCYVIKLTVNAGIAGEEKQDTQILRVLQVKSRKGIPGAGETTNADASRGWATPVNALLQYHDDQLAKGRFLVAQTAAAGLVAGTVVRFGDLATLKAGLPGEESVPTVNKALATSASAVDELLGVIESDLDGGTTPGSGVLVRVRTEGVYGPVSEAGSTVGDPVYVSDTGTLSLADGTNSRVVGHVVEAGATEFYVMFSGSIGVGAGGGAGTVTSVTAADTTVTVAGTATDPTVAVNLAHAFAWTVGHGWTATDATVNAITDLHTITHRRSAGTAAAGFGTGVLMRGDDDANNLEDMARIGAVWVTPTNAAEASAFVLQLRNAGAALSEVARISGLGGFVMANMTAGTNAVADMITVSQSTSGVAAPGFGSGILLRAENATSPNLADQVRIGASWLVATHTAETSFLDITLREAGTNRSWLSGSLIGSTTLGHYSATTNAVDDMLTLTHRTSGTAAAGFGSGILFTGEDASDGADNMGRLAFSWTDATAASEDSAFKVQLRVGGAALSDRMIIDGGTRAQFNFGSTTAPGSTAFEVATSAAAGRGYFSSTSVTGVSGWQGVNDSGGLATGYIDGTSTTRCGVAGGSFFTGYASEAHFGSTANFDSHWITGSADSTADRVASAIYNSGNRYLDICYFYQLSEMAAPATPAANKARVYLWDNAGATTLSVIWPSGSITDLSADPGP